jgi:hypothetical protein
MSKRAPLSFNTEKVTSASLAPTVKTGLPPNAQTEKRENAQSHQRSNIETSKRANTQTKKGRAGRQFLAAHILPEAAKQFKLLAVQRDKTTQDMLIEAINDLFAKHGLSRIAD